MQFFAAIKVSHFYCYIMLHNLHTQYIHRAQPLTCPVHGEIVGLRILHKSGKVSYRCSKLSSGKICGFLDSEVKSVSKPNILYCSFFCLRLRCMPVFMAGFELMIPTILSGNHGFPFDNHWFDSKPRYYVRQVVINRFHTIGTTVGLIDKLL